MNESSPRRPHCAGCLRPQSACICAWITPVAHEVEVLILQHPLEVDHPKGSARLLHLSLPHSRLVTGDVFVDAALLAAPFEVAGSAVDAPRHNLLLYPDMPQDQALGVPAPPALPAGWLREPSRLRLIVLDGSWRKSRKMLYLSPPLQHLPRLSLQGLPPSRYGIRKAHRPGQLSTLEATCAALMQLEGNAGKFEPLLTAFDGFVAQQLGYLPSRPGR
ncbi:MAG: tRNA-uridine aminocarboxypropyltransferase [Polaromonas sp.]|uniref:tRNA-uridine aminocarboxypropyltransferase n=1 Tax=Polaromonas sp. TaxID=1869339 RepID=UPI002731B3C3|nr:tRNA-uridine aminocarboxypropyltransferase [Polaromonas sp.]MDP2450061.1 tRNA-uridine aminocarboxypropyltransferase [Polaromonas sp.]MDP3247544.1 tRNA-uridine aminocarboxypropyltransferase [Polaromonas sp.]MDP3755339.1 tRNA-uridine aminocarboxypropyltransferase [Polaromonas sp.]MDP3826984.1 tRNA-uridine aminocarboxypropyltransferase [Polaromonas sp.]